MIVLATSLLLKKYEITFPWYVAVAAMAIIECAYSMGVLTIPGVVMNDMLRFEVSMFVYKGFAFCPVKS